MKTKRILSLLLAVAMLLVVVSGCGAPANEPSSSTPESSSEAPADSSKPEPEPEPEPDSPLAADAQEEIDVEAYEATSSELYDAILGEFLATYEAGKNEVDDIDLRYALMATAEAKLLASAVMMPTTSSGGMYQISRVAPRTVDYAQSGNDPDRIAGLVVTTEPIKNEDYQAIRAHWTEEGVRGSGEFKQWVKDYLVEKGYELSDSYTTTFSADPQTWDFAATSRAADTIYQLPSIDGLVEFDCEGTLQPKLAKSWEISDDGLTYTFHLRDDVNWVDSQGREVAKFSADDFVAGMNHVMDAQGGLEFLVDGVIKNAHEYINGEVTDFAEVGVTAPDATTLVYTLEKKTPYFMTMLGYSVFLPLCRSYFEGLGGAFGVDEWSEASETCTFGTSPETMAYCGGYVITNFTSLNTVAFKARDDYYDPDSLEIKNITYIVNDGSDPTKAYNDMKANTITGCNLSPVTIELARNDNLFDDFAHLTANATTSYMAFFNINRHSFSNSVDASACVSAQTVADAERTYTAMQNVHFRRALAFGLDRISWNEQTSGAEAAKPSLRNGYTPWNFVELEKDTTIDINGTATTFPAGTPYGKIVQAQLDADGVAIKFYDPSADNGLGSGDGYDGWYSPANCAAELEQAVVELADLDISASNPIIVDLPYASQSETRTNAANVFKQSVEKASNGMIQVNLVACKDNPEWYATGYYTDYGYEANYNIYDLSGWGPDYTDPSTYLDTFLPDYAGYMIKCIGIF